VEKIKDKTSQFTERSLAYLLSVGGLAGLVAAFVLTVEKIEILKDPNFQPSCNINPILSCGSVMTTPQAEVFGFPNSLIGLVGFTAVSVTGFAILAGAKFKRWYWVLLHLGVLLAVGFVHWLIFQTIYRIGALCPYCMVVWAVTIPIFWYTLLYNLQSGYIKTPSRLKGVVRFMQGHYADVLLVWFLAIIGVITYEFWYYWSSLF
jgi:uncharacterized membrane protein